MSSLRDYYAYTATDGRTYPLRSSSVEDCVEEIRSSYFARTYAINIIHVTHEVVAHLDGREL